MSPSILIVWYGFIQQIVFGIPFGDNPAPDFAMWLVWLLIGIGLPILLWRARLEVRVQQGQLEYAWYPLIDRAVQLSDIKSAEAKTYRPIMEYGGWGLRWGGRRGWAYSMRGNRGVFIECHDGKCFLLGSQKADELADAINASINQ